MNMKKEYLPNVIILFLYLFIVIIRPTYFDTLCTDVKIKFLS